MTLTLTFQYQFGIWSVSRICLSQSIVVALSLAGCDGGTRVRVVATAPQCQRLLDLIGQ
jgi:hypothetical protein